MRTRQSTESVPSLHDQFSDAHAGRHGFADAPAPDEPRHEYSEAEEQALFELDLARRASAASAEPHVPAGWHAALCQGCSVALLVQDGSGDWALCSRCAAAAVSAA